MKIIRIAAVLLAATACASAKLPSLRDPAYANHEFANVAVYAVGMYPGDLVSVENAVCNKMAPARCVSGRTLLAPARSYSPDEIEGSLAKANADGVLVFMIGDDQVASAFLANIVSSSRSSSQSSPTSLFRDIASWIAPPPSRTTPDALHVPIYDYERAGHAIAGLFDRSTGKTAWGGELNVSGHGETSVSDEAFVEAATKQLAGQLTKNRLVRVPATASGGQ